MSTWRWYEYDVWGNKKDGYEVNQVFRTSQVFEIPDVVLNSDKDIIKYLRKVGFIRKGVKARDIGFGEMMYEDTIDIEYKGRPEGEFRRE